MTTIRKDKELKDKGKRDEATSHTRSKQQRIVRERERERASKHFRFSCLGLVLTHSSSVAMTGYDWVGLLAFAQGHSQTCLSSPRVYRLRIRQP